MDYRVRLTRRAERDLGEIFEHIYAGNSPAAGAWYAGLRKAILSLERDPKRGATTPENTKMRHLLYGHRRHVYRMIYRVMERKKEVEILHIRHGAMKRVTPGDLE